MMIYFTNYFHRKQNIEKRIPSGRKIETLGHLRVGVRLQTEMAKLASTLQGYNWLILMTKVWGKPNRHVDVEQSNGHFFFLPA